MQKRETVRGRTRSTRQRRIILEQLQSLTCHPTAEQLFRLVRCHLPQISLGTVYRNLEVLIELGQIQRLEATGGQMHFDGNPTPHCHIRCHACGAVADVDWPHDLPPVEELGSLTDWQITACTVELSGYCPACRDEAQDQPDQYQEAANVE